MKVRMSAFVRNMRNMTRRSRTGELPEAVSRLYGIDRATPVRPLFVFIVGSPGVGKSQAHKALYELGVFREGDTYATINLDTLLESLVAFRAGSALGHAIKTELGSNYPEGAKKFSSLKSYGSKKSNVGAFDFIQDSASRSELVRALPAKIAAKKGIDIGAAESEVLRMFSRFDTMASEFAPGEAVSESLIDLTAEAIDAAIAKRINIVWETTFSSIEKFNSYYGKLVDNDYMIVVLHIVDSAEHISQKIQSRQEYNSPFGDYPFYRYVSTGKDVVKEFIRNNTNVVKKIRDGIAKEVYDPDLVYVEEYTAAFDPSRLKGPVDFNFMTQAERILSAYGSNAAPRSVPRARRTRRAPRR